MTQIDTNATLNESTHESSKISLNEEKKTPLMSERGNSYSHWQLNVIKFQK